MKRKKKESVTFDNIVYLAEENKKSFPVYMRLLQLFAVLCGSYCFITVFIRCFDLNLIDSRLYWGIGLTGCIFFILFVFPLYDIIKVIFAAGLYAGMFYRYFKHIENGFYLLENVVIKCASKYYGFDEFRFVADYTNPEWDLTVIVIFILIPVTGLLAYSMLRGRLSRLTYIIMIIPVAASFAMGITPPEFQLIAYILLFLFLYASNGLLHVADYSHNKSGMFHKSMIYRISIKSALLLCLISLTVFFLLKLFVPAKRYENYDKIKVAKSKIQNRMMSFSLQDVSDKIANVKWRLNPNRRTSAGGLNYGRLGRVDQVVYDNAEHLLIKTPLSSISEGIYMRGYIGSLYTGDSWETHSGEVIVQYEKVLEEIDRDVFEPAIGSSELLKNFGYRFTSKKGRFEVNYLKADKRYIYAPYFSLFTKEDGVRFEHDLAILADNETETGTYDYFYNLELESEENFKKRFYDLLWEGYDTIGQISEYTKYEEAYRKFVYETYTRLPDKGLERLKQDFSREAMGKYAENLVEAISYIKKYLYDNTRYTLAPGRLPGDKDFVEYFLYESKLGYCIHYASAGVLMLRAMGYPARYVEGYAVNRSDLTNSSSIYLDETDGEDSIVEITVRDYNAHAWAEVYFDGFGWIPVEFTVGAGMEDMVGIIADIYGETRRVPDIEPTLPPTQAPTPVPVSPSPSPKPEDKPVNETEPTRPASSGGDSGPGANEKNRETGGAGRLEPYRVIIPIFILTAVVFSYIYRKAKNKADGENYSRKALDVYKKIERIFIAGRLLPKREKYLEDNEEFAMKNLSLVPVTEFEECMNIVRKARFGRETISFVEYLTVKNFYNKLYKRVYESLPRIKRIRFILIHPIKN